uniref:Ig-like domain-containing protein n=1 Tax=Crocodylus porosus TaxID=8502 RepID=A0A7M4DZE9_CROPO
TGGWVPQHLHGWPLALVPGCCAQVTQPPTASVSPRGTVQLSCTLGGSYTVSSNRVVWIQQKQGNAPRFLLYFFTESNKGMGSGVPSRFSGSRSGSDKEGYLTITGALEEDDAVYYCATWTGSACTMLQACGEVRQKQPTTCYPDTKL